MFERFLEQYYTIYFKFNIIDRREEILQILHKELYLTP